MKKLYFLFFTLLLGYSASAQLIINEILYDPPSGIAGDANGDGTREPTEDGFIEFINNSATNLDVSGYMIYDFEIATSTRTLRHTVPTGTIIPPNGAFVVFGGGTPNGSFGGAVVIADTGTAGLSMNNSGERIQVEDALGTQILEFDSDALSNNPDESYTRDPDVTGEFVQHEQDTNSNITAFFSPGTRIDGASFNTILSTEQFQINEFNLYPNPVNNGILNISSNSSETISVLIFDILGKQVITGKVNNNRIIVSELKTGLYIVKLSQNNTTTTKKLIIN
jgi:hypothetical protein